MTVGQRHSEVTRKSTSKRRQEERGILTHGSSGHGVFIAFSFNLPWSSWGWSPLLSPAEMLTEVRCLSAPKWICCSVSKARCELKFPIPILALGKPFLFLAKLIAKYSSDSAARQLSCTVLKPALILAAQLWLLFDLVVMRHDVCYCSKARRLLPIPLGIPLGLCSIYSLLFCRSNNLLYLLKLISSLLLKKLVGREENIPTCCHTSICVLY